MAVPPASGTEDEEGACNRKDGALDLALDMECETTGVAFEMDGVCHSAEVPLDTSRDTDGDRTAEVPLDTPTRDTGGESDKASEMDSPVLDMEFEMAAVACEMEGICHPAEVPLGTAQVTDGDRRAEKPLDTARDTKGESDRACEMDSPVLDTEYEKPAVLLVCEMDGACHLAEIPLDTATRDTDGNRTAEVPLHTARDTDGESDRACEMDSPVLDMEFEMVVVLACEMDGACQMAEVPLDMARDTDGNRMAEVPLEMARDTGGNSDWGCEMDSPVLDTEFETAAVLACEMDGACLLAEVPLDGASDANGNCMAEVPLDTARDTDGNRMAEVPLDTATDTGGESDRACEMDSPVLDTECETAALLACEMDRACHMGEVHHGKELGDDPRKDPGPWNFAPPLDVRTKVASFLVVETPQETLYIALSTLDVYYARNLKHFLHGIEYIDPTTAFARMANEGHSYRFISADQTYITDDFGIVHFHADVRFQKILRDCFPPGGIEWAMYFEFLYQCGEHQELRDDDNEAPSRFDAGTGSEYCPSLHNPSGIASGLSLNVGKSTLNSFESCTTIKQIIGTFLDISQLVCDAVRADASLPRIYNDPHRHQMYSQPSLGEIFDSLHVRGETTANFLKDTYPRPSNPALQGRKHKDDLNGVAPSYDYTVCMSGHLLSESTGRIRRFVCNTNSRASVEAVLLKEAALYQLTGPIRQELLRIGRGYAHMVAGFPPHVRPEVTDATSFANMELGRYTPFVHHQLPNGTSQLYVECPSSPTRDYHLSSVISRIDEIKEKFRPPTRLLLGYLLIAIHSPSYFQYYVIMGHLLSNENLSELALEQLPLLFWNVSTNVFCFPSFLGGLRPRIQATAFDFSATYVNNTQNFVADVHVLQQILLSVNNNSFSGLSHFHEYLGGQSEGMNGIALFKLQFFLPMAALCGLVRPASLKYADLIHPADGPEGGSHATLTAHGFQPHQFGYVILNLCQRMGFQRRESIGECLTCESHRTIKRFDLFYPGQSLHHMFLGGNHEYTVKKKPFGERQWVLQPFYHAD